MMWKLHANVGLWESAVATARIDMRCPEKGLFEFEWNGTKLPNMQLNQLHGPTRDNGPADLIPGSSFVRDGVLIQPYDDAADVSTRFQIEWRMVQWASDTLWIDTLVSADTQQLDYRPRFRLESTIPARQRERLPAKSSSPEAWAWDVSLFRLTPVPLTCAQIMDTSDVAADQVVSRDDTLQRGTDVFAAPLEKGVVRSVLVRSVLTQRAHDVDNVQRAWQDLANAYPLPQF